MLRLDRLGRGSRPFLALGLGLALSALPAATRAQGPEERPVLNEVVDVRLINLDAVVTDRAEQPVLGLEPDDFDLRVNGQRVEVLGVSQGQELRETVSGRLTVVILLDERHLQSAHRDRTLSEIGVALVDEMRSHPTWAAVAALSGQLEPLLAPTRDPEAMRDALAAAMARELPASDLLRAQRAASDDVLQMLRQLTRTGSSYRMGEMSKSGVFTRLRIYGEALARDTRNTLAGLGSLVEALSFVPGRKAVLFVSDGLPRQPLDLVAKTMFDRLSGGSRQYDGDELLENQGSLGINDPNNRPSGSDRADMSGMVRVAQEDDGGAMEFQLAVLELGVGEELDRLAALANTHGVTFYPLKPPVVDPTLADLGERAEDRDSIVLLSDMRSGPESLAHATGGLSFVAQHGVSDFLRQTRSDLAAYYSLSFTPPDSLDSTGLREMVLRVRQRKTQVRYRASYVPISLEQSLSSRAWGTLLFHWEENLHGVEVQSTVVGQEGTLLPVDVVLSLPIAKVELVPTLATWSSTFKVVLQLRRSDGLRLEPEYVGFVVQIPADDLETARQQYFAVRTRLRVEPGSYDAAIGLWEESSGQASFVLHELVVGPEEQKNASLRRPDPRSTPAGSPVAAAL